MIIGGNSLKYKNSKYCNICGKESDNLREVVIERHRAETKDGKKKYIEEKRIVCPDCFRKVSLKRT